MTIIESVKKETVKEDKENIKEFMDVTFDKLRRMGSLAGSQLRLYNFINMRLEKTILAKLANLISDFSERAMKDDINPEEQKETIKLALLDWVDSHF